jgi:hypothetical protein
MFRLFCVFVLTIFEPFFLNGFGPAFSISCEPQGTGWKLPLHISVRWDDRYASGELSRMNYRCIFTRRAARGPEVVNSALPFAF